MKKILILLFLCAGKIVAQQEPCFLDKIHFVSRPGVDEHDLCVSAYLADIRVGHVVYHKPVEKKDIGTLIAIGVEKNYRNKGVGSKLLSYAMDDMKNHGCKQAHWKVVPFHPYGLKGKPLSMENTIKFYQKNGAELVTQSPHPEYRSDCSYGFTQLGSWGPVRLAFSPELVEGSPRAVAKLEPAHPEPVEGSEQPLMIKRLNK